MASTAAPRRDKAVYAPVLHSVVEQAPQTCEAEELRCCGCPPIEPNSTMRKGWDAWILGTIAWVMTVIPVRLCFFTTDTEQDAIVEAVLDITWLIDLFIRFRTAYEHHETGHIVRSRRKIAINYAARGMLMDLVAVVPCIYEVLVPAFSTHRARGQSLSTIVWMGGSRLCKTFRCAISQAERSIRFLVRLNIAAAGLQGFRS